MNLSCTDCAIFKERKVLCAEKKYKQILLINIRLFAFSFIYQMNANHQVFKSNFETLSESLIKKTMTQQTQEMELIATVIIILDDEDESFIEGYNKQQYGINKLQQMISFDKTKIYKVFILFISLCINGSFIVKFIFISIYT